MRVALITRTIECGGNGILADRPPPENPRTDHYITPLPHMESLDHVPDAQVARASMSVERLDSYKFNTIRITFGAELPCTPEELRDHTAHNTLGNLLSEQMHEQYLSDGALLGVWTDSIIELIADRDERERR